MSSSKKRVIFCGENPEIRLMLSVEEEAPTAIASYWICRYSEYGPGNVLIAGVSTPLFPSFTVIYADNLALGRFLADEIVQHFEFFRAFNLPQIQVSSAAFAHKTDGKQLYQVICQSEQNTVDIIWRDVLDYREPKLFSDMTGGLSGEKKLEVNTVICPVKEGTITIDDQVVEGQVTSYQDGGLYRSSAFLAFCETWIEHTS